MNARVFFAILLSLAISLIGCASAPPAQLPHRPVPAPQARSMADEAFRAKPPFATDASEWTPPKILERRLPNGVRVLVVDRHDVPVVAVRIVSDRGADQADRGIPEVWAQSILTAGVDHPWYEVREALERMGVRWEASTRPDATEIELQVLSKLFAPTLKLVGDLMTKPVVSEAALERARVRVATAIRSADLKVAAHRAAGRWFYPHKHLYNEPFAPSENVAKVTTDLVLAYHAAAFTPARTTIAIAGDVEPEATFDMIGEAFGALSGAKLGAVTPPPTPPAPPTARVLVIDTNAASQAHLTALWLAPTLGSEDEHGLMFARQMLTAALFEDVRRDRGATYGMRVSTPFGRGAQLTRVEGFVQLESVIDAVKDILANVDRLTHDPPSEQAMSWARLGATSAITGLFEGPESTAAAMSILGLRDGTSDYFTQRLGAVRSTTAGDVHRAARTWLAPDAIRFIVVGDAKKLRAPIEALGIGAVVVRARFLP